MLTEFRNVTIGIDADTPAEAYEKLCTALAKIAEWQTDTYVTYGPNDSIDSESEEHSTGELFAKGN